MANAQFKGIDHADETCLLATVQLGAALSISCVYNTAACPRCSHNAISTSPWELTEYPAAMANVNKATTTAENVTVSQRAVCHWVTREKHTC